MKHGRQFFNLDGAWPSFLGGNRSGNVATRPTLIMWGKEDPWLNPSWLQQHMGRFIQAPYQIKMIPLCGHWLPQEVPLTVNRELIQFLKDSDL